MEAGIPRRLLTLGSPERKIRINNSPLTDLYITLILCHSPRHKGRLRDRLPESPVLGRLCSSRGIYRLLASQLLEMLSILLQTSFPVYLSVTATVLAALLLWETLRAWSRLSHVPGPFWAGFSKYWMVSQSLKGQQPYAIQKANEKYGKLRPRASLGKLSELETESQARSYALGRMSWLRMIQRCSAA